MRHLPFLLLFIIAFAASCKKDITEEPVQTLAKYTLVTEGTNCSNSSVHGNYTVGIPVSGDNYITLAVDVTATGKYSIYTGTIEGFRFLDSGMFLNTGKQTVTLKSMGMPTSAGNIVFTLYAASSSCNFTVLVNGNSPNVILDNDHMLFGNPTNAAPVIDSINNFLMRKPYYALSYSRERGIPNWVSWHLFANDLGATQRQDDFRPDNALPTGWFAVQANSYSGSGFDRGHNTPSADRTSSIEANSSTFLMTNIIPQAPFHNQQTWNNMEDSLRRLITAGNELYIVMGNYGAGGTGSNGFATTISGGKITVPASIWKIAVVIPNGNNDSSRVTTSTRIIAVDIPNNNSVNSNWKNYRVSIDAIEAAAGINLLSRLPISLQAAIEAKVDNW